MSSEEQPILIEEDGDVAASGSQSAGGSQSSQMEDSQSHSQSQSQPADDSSSHVDAYSSALALSAITVRLTAPPVDSLTPSALPALHLLPCRIAHTGPANVPNYFRPQKAEAKQAVLTFDAGGAKLQECEADNYDARFRGRQMNGTIMQLPEKARGFVFEEDHTPQVAPVDADDGTTDEAEPSANAKEPSQPQTTWKTTSTFSSFMLWQPDLEMFERRHIKESVHEWMAIAHAIHDPIATTPAATPAA